MPIYNGTQKVSFSGKIYVGTQLVYQNGPKLTSITLSGQTTSLNRDDAFSFGGTVTAHYSNGATADVTSSTTFSGYNMALGEIYTVTASYTENGVTATATYTLTVNKAWSTIYSTSKSCSITFSGTITGAGNIVQTVADTGLKPRIRITFTFSTYAYSNDNKFKYYNNSNTTSTSKPTSPRYFNPVGSANNLKLLGINSVDGTRIINNVYLKKVNQTNRVQLVFDATHSGTVSNNNINASITISKIEQYY